MLNEPTTWKTIFFSHFASPQKEIFLKTSAEFAFIYLFLLRIFCEISSIIFIEFLFAPFTDIFLKFILFVILFCKNLPTTIHENFLPLILLNIQHSTAQYSVDAGK